MRFWTVFGHPKSIIRNPQYDPLFVSQRVHSDKRSTSSYMNLDTVTSLRENRDFPTQADDPRLPGVVDAWPELSRGDSRRNPGDGRRRIGKRLCRPPDNPQGLGVTGLSQRSEPRESPPDGPLRRTGGAEDVTPLAVTATPAKRSAAPLNAVARGIGLVLGTKPSSAEMSMVSPDSYPPAGGDQGRSARADLSPARPAFGSSRYGFFAWYSVNRASKSLRFRTSSFASRLWAFSSHVTAAPKSPASA